jgi:hypothetical protein
VLTKDRTFIFFLQNSASGACYWLDSGRNVRQSSIFDGLDQDLTIETPDGWKDMSLGFEKNADYQGFNRSFSFPAKLIDDAAYIVRTLFNTPLGHGIETPITMTVLKYNDNPNPGDAQYALYWTGRLDLFNLEDDVAEGVKVNMIEGGVMQVVKAMENIIFELPCDGSIPENIQVYMDGMYVEDTAYFDFIPMSGVFAGDNPIATQKTDEDGDSFGVQLGDQQYEQASTGYFQTSGNYSCSFQQPTTVQITGSITVRPFNSSNPANFGLYAATTLSVPVAGGISHAINLIPGFQNGANVGATVEIWQPTTFKFDKTINLAANEGMFLMWFNQFSAHNIVIMAGSFKLHYNTKPNDTFVWGLTMFDEINLLVKNMCALSSRTFQPINFGFASTLLQSRRDLVVTSGDALRASGDPNYQKFFNAIQNNPNFPNINEFYSYGPVIKTTLKDAFTAAKVQLMAAMGNQQLTGENETLFLEVMGYVYDSSKDTFDLGEVSGVKMSVQKDYLYNILEIGYDIGDFDQKSAKYEWNTKATWQLPFKSFTGKTLQLICPYQASAYKMERLRAGLNDTSITRNDGDNTVFLLNVDLTRFLYSFFNAFFQSGVSDPNQINNTNLLLLPRKLQQPVMLPNVQGGFFSQGTDPSIFVLNQQGLSAVSKPFIVNLGGTFLGNPANALVGTPADTLTIKLYVNGAVQNIWVFTATGALINWNISAYTFTRGWSYKDCVYMSAATTINGTANITSGQMQCDTGGAYWGGSVVGTQTIQPGTGWVLIPFSAVTAAVDSNNLPVVSYGFQYIYFNSIVINNNFNGAFSISGFNNGGTPNNSFVDLFFNGASISSATIPPNNSGAKSPWSFTGAPFNYSLKLGDLFFITAGAMDVSTWIAAANLTLTSTQIKGYYLLRKKYDTFTGVPCLALDANGIPNTSLPGAPYNVELSPKRIFEIWFPWIKSMVFDQAPGTIYFGTLTKNQYFSTTLKGVTITENADVSIGEMGDPMWIPRLVKAILMTPMTFAQAMSGAVNSHMSMTYGGVPITFFAQSLKQKPAFLEAQEWVGMISPKTNLSIFQDLNYTGLNLETMASQTIFSVFLNPCQHFNPNAVQNPQYHTYNRNSTPFYQQISRWIQTRNFWQPWQQNDTVNLQYITNGLSPLTVSIYQCGNPNVYATISGTVVSSPAVPSPYILYQVSIPLSTFAEGIYFFDIVAGASGTTAEITTEGLWVKADWEDTVLAQYTSSSNKQGGVFQGTGWAPMMRFWGMYDNMFQQKYTGASYVGQPQNIKVLNGVPYEVTKLWVGMGYGHPDWQIKKVHKILVLDGTTLDGEGFTFDVGAEWDEIKQDGAPMKFHSTTIRPTENLNGLIVTANNGPEDSSMLVTIDALAMGPNAYGLSGGVEADIIQITLE